MLTLRIQPIPRAGAGEVLRRLRYFRLAPRSGIETLCFVVSVIFCLAAVGLLTVISMSVAADMLRGW
jgi:hypothetical protein